MTSRTGSRHRGSSRHRAGCTQPALGGVRLSAAIELSVLQGDRVLGSSADGLIVTSAGTHDLELINTSFGFRTRGTVTFRAGEITSMAIAVPPGRLNVNAVPWAEVWIDGVRSVRLHWGICKSLSGSTSSCSSTRISVCVVRRSWCAPTSSPA